MTGDHPWRAEAPSFRGGQSGNVASGNAQVHSQVGHADTWIEHADTVHLTRTYGTAEDPPKKKFETACRYLAINARTRAAGLIGDVVAAGYSSTEVAYYWALAVLSGRALEHLSTDDLATLHSAHVEAGRHDPDQWSAALDVVRRYLACLVGQERTGVLDPDDHEVVKTAYASLPAGRREEIGHHLREMLSGVGLDLSDADLAAVVRARRMGNERMRRVPLFFEPDPAPPKRIRAVPVSRHAGPRALFVGGVLVAGLGAGLALTALAVADPVVTAAVALLCGTGGMVVVGYGREHRYLVSRRAARERQIAGTEPDEHAVGFAPAAPTEFSAEISRLVTLRFTRTMVASGMRIGSGNAVAETGGVQVALRRDLVELYGHQIPPVRPDSVDWLIRWHAERTARDWQTGALYGFRERLRLPPGILLVLAAGVVTLCLGALLGLVVLARADVVTALASALLLGFGGRFLTVWGLVIDGEKRRYRDDDAEYASRYAEETAAYQRQVEYLADMPDDVEMAEWLELDKDHLTIEAMKLYGLTNRQVIARFALTEPAWPCGQARELFGPPRYTAYRVRVFLLTTNGVRQIDRHLNFVSGALNDERRTTFRYDAIASVRVEESSTRPHGRRQVATPEGGGPDTTPRPILSQALELTLVNGEPVRIAVNYDSQLPEEYREDAEMLRQLARDTSGVVTALRFLESVAAEGREWVGRRRAR